MIQKMRKTFQLYQNVDILSDIVISGISNLLASYDRQFLKMSGTLEVGSTRYPYVFLLSLCLCLCKGQYLYHHTCGKLILTGISKHH